MPTALVTGATNGIGLEIARGLAAAGWRVYVHGRSAAKAQAACDGIRASTGNEAVLPILADFDALDAVRAMAGQFLAGGEVLDLLVSNAAVVTLRREQTVDGFERMLGVNCLAACLLVRLLLPALRCSPQGRVVIVASEAHRFVKGMRWDDLQSQQGFKAMKTYGHSKLGNLLFAHALAAHEPWLRVYAAHPGAVSTGLGTQNGWLGKWVPRLLKPFFRSPAQGAATPLMLALEDIPAPSGSYFANGRLRQAAPWACDAAAAERLWQQSTALCGLPPTV